MGLITFCHFGQASAAIDFSGSRATRLSHFGNLSQKGEANSDLLLCTDFCWMVGTLLEASATKKATKKSQPACSLPSQRPHFTQGR